MREKSSTSTLTATFVLTVFTVAGYAAAAFGRLRILPILDLRFIWGDVSGDPVVAAIVSSPVLLPAAFLLAAGLFVSAVALVALVLVRGRWVAAAACGSAAISFAPHFDGILRLVGTASAVIAVGCVAAPFARRWTSPPLHHLIAGAVLAAALGVAGRFAVEHGYDREALFQQSLDEIAATTSALIAENRDSTGFYPLGEVTTASLDDRLSSSDEAEADVWEFLARLPGVMFSYSGDSSACRATFAVAVPGSKAVSFLALPDETRSGPLSFNEAGKPPGEGS